MYKKNISWFLCALFVVALSKGTASPTVVRPNAESAPILVIDIKPGVFVKNFRSTPMSMCKVKDNWLCLHASASGTFRAGFLESLKNLVGRSPLYIVDLRQESHGFVNGMPISWYGYRNASNVGKSLSQIEDEETKALKKLSEESHFTLNHIIEKEGGVIEKIEPFEVVPNQVVTERQLVESFGIHYFRIPVLDRYKPTDQQVDTLLDFVKNLPENAWVHFHCRGGVGRSTTFFILYDIIRNGDKASFEEIIQRDSLIGPVNILKLPSEEVWKYKPALERAKFLKDFYTYRNDPKGFGSLSWSEWRKRASETK